MSDLAETGRLIAWMEEWARPAGRDASIHKHEDGWGVALLVKGENGWEDLALASAPTVAEALAHARWLEGQVDTP